MDPSLRNTSGLVGKIERLRDDLIKHFEALVSRAGIDKTDRNSTAITQYQMQVDTAAIIRAAESLQVLIRQMQELWLFGQLDTLGDGKGVGEVEGKAREVADMLKILMEKQVPAGSPTEAGGDAAVGNGPTNGNSNGTANETTEMIDG